MRARHRLLAAAAWLLFAVAVAIAVTRFSTTGDITYFLPDSADGEAREALAVARALAGSPLGRSMVLSIAGPVAPATRAARGMADALAADPAIAAAHAGPPPGLEEALYRVFFPARLGFLSDRPATLPERLDDAGLVGAMRELKAALAGPLGAAIARAAPADPLLAFTRHLERYQAARPPGVEVEDGVFVARGAAGDRALVFVATAPPPFAAAEQRALLARIAARFAALDPRGELRLEMAGLNRLATAAEAATRDDVTRITTLSLIGTSLLFLVCFRSPRYFAVLFVPIGFGIAGGLAACLLVFGEVHGVTLAFGATLIGVSDDYTVHYLQHHILAPSPTGPRGSLRAVWGAILLGGVTTTVGFAGMAWTSTPGMRQIALFGTVGIAFALLATYAVLPTLVPATPRGAAGLSAARRWMTRLLDLVQRRRAGLVALPLAALALVAVALPAMRWNDDPAALTTIDAALVAEDEAVRRAVDPSDPGRLVVARAASDEDALAINDAVAAALDDARAAGELTGFDSLHALVWSRRLQQQNLDALAATPDLAARLDAAAAAEGFRPGAFAPLAEALAAPARPIGLDDLAAELAPLLHGYTVRHGEERLILTRLTGVADEDALRARIAAIPGAVYLDQRAAVQSAYGGFRARVLEIVGVGLAFVLAVVWLRYRKVRDSLAALVPALLAAAAALAVLVLCGVELTLLHVLGLIWVLSTGVDYSVFMVEAARAAPGSDAGDVGLAMVGTAISCATTILAFGLLAMSSIPALRALGSIAAIGGTLSFVLTPLALLIMGRRS